MMPTYSPRRSAFRSVIDNLMAGWTRRGIASPRRCRPNLLGLESRIVPATPIVQFKTALSTVAEGHADPILVTLNTGGGNLASTISFNVVTTLGTASAADFTAPVATVTFNAGAANGTTQTINLPALTDNLVEGNETLALGLTLKSGTAVVGTQKSHGVTILDANTASVSFTTASSTAAEGGAADAIVAKLNIASGAKLANSAVFNVVTTLGTASAADFTIPSTITFAANAVSGATQTISFQAVTDTLVEGSETLTVGLTPQSGAVTVPAGVTHAVTITDASSAKIAFTTATSNFAEDGAAHTITAKLSITGGGTLAKDVVVNVTPTLGTASTTDFTLGATSITFAAGSADGATQNVSITPTADTLVEANETVTLGLSVASGPATVGTQASNVVTITDDDTAKTAYANMFLADWNGDGIADLIYVRNNTNAAQTQIQILNGATNFTTDLLPLTSIGLHQTDTTWTFGVGDYNADGKLDLYAINQSGTGSNTTEIHILSGADNFQTFLLHGRMPWVPPAATGSSRSPTSMATASRTWWPSSAAARNRATPRSTCWMGRVTS